MTLLAVVFTAWACPGGPLAGVWPAPVRPLVCQARPTIELYDPAREGAARRRVAALGAPAQLYACSGARCGDPLVTWSTSPSFKENSK